MDEELQVGDLVEVVYEGSANYGKRGVVVEIHASLYYVVKIEGQLPIAYSKTNGSLRKIPKDICICDKIFLFNNGCKCGHWEREKRKEKRVGETLF